jgi:hypothetical protein
MGRVGGHTRKLDGWALQRGHRDVERPPTRSAPAAVHCKAWSRRQGAGKEISRPLRRRDARHR